MTSADPSLLQELASLTVEALNLETPPDQIDVDLPLYGDGLGLDSIDILELAMVVSKRYGLQLKSENDENARIFGSLRSLADHVAQHRTV